MDNLKRNIYPCLNFETINAYLAGELSDTESNELEMHLSECLLCNDAIEGYSLLPVLSAKAGSTYTVHTAKKLLKGLDKKVESKLFEPQQKIFHLHKFYRAIAASLIFALIAGSALFFWINRNNSDSYDQFFSSYQNVHYFTFRGETQALTAEELLIMESFNQYDAGNFIASAGTFETVLKAAPENTVVRFYLGMSYMELDVFEQALNQFEIVRVNDPNLYIESSFYAALCYVRLDEKQNAINILQEIQDTEHPRFKKAEALLQTLL